MAFEPKADTATGKEGFNRAGFSTPELDRLLEQARSVPGCDQGRRKDLYAPIQEQVAEGSGWNFLYQARTPVASNKKLNGLDPSSFRRVLYNAQTWTMQP